MKKIINILREKDIDVILLIIILTTGITMFMPLIANDEFWNFANSYKMFVGYEIYRDLNVIITPMFFYIAQIFLRIFGATMLSFRIYNIAISSIFLILIYTIFKALKIVKRRAVFYTIIITFICNGMIAAGANYNIMVIIPTLIIINLIIRKKENPWLFGILLFFTFMIKQNVFVYLAIGIFVYEIINKKNIKSITCDLFKIYFISSVGIIIFLIHMYLNNNLYNFINYCFLGIGEFAQKNIHINFEGARYIYISIIAIIFTFVIRYNKKINTNIDKNVLENVKCLLSFGIPMLLMSYPLFNFYHSTLSSIIIFIEFIYIIEILLVKEMQIERKKEKKIYIIITIIYIIYLYSSMPLTMWKVNKGEFIFYNNGSFYGTTIDKESYEEIQMICNYIKEQENSNIDVKVLSYKANMYMVQLNKNNERFDLPFLGNFGAGGEKSLINEIKRLSNTMILIETEFENFFGQESKTIRDYIIDNYEKIGEIQQYSIYYIK